MDNTYQDADKPKTGKTSELIIITPDELAKLGLIPEVIHTTGENSNPEVDNVTSNATSREGETASFKNTDVLSKKSNMSGINTDYLSGENIKWSASDTDKHFLKRNINDDNFFKTVNKNLKDGKNKGSHEILKNPQSPLEGDSLEIEASTNPHINKITANRIFWESGDDRKQKPVMLQKPSCELMHKDDKEVVKNTQKITETHMAFKSVASIIPNTDKSCNIDQKPNENNKSETNLKITNGKAVVLASDQLLSEDKSKTEIFNQREQKNLNAASPHSSKTSATVPKKRKYLMNFSGEGLTEETYNEEINDSHVNQNETAKDIQENNCENSSNDVMTIPKKRGRPSKSLASSSVTAQDESKETVQNQAQQKVNGKSGNGTHTCLKEKKEPETLDSEIDSGRECLSSFPENSLKDIPSEIANQVKTNQFSSANVKAAKGKGRPKKTSLSKNISDSRLPASTGAVAGVKKNSELEDCTSLEMEDNSINNEVQVKSEENGKSTTLTSGSNELTSADVTEIVLSTNVVNTASTPLPKKRGRKKKSEQAPQVPSPIVTESVELDESRSGRKRKKVNYLELANELEENFDGEYKKRHKFSLKSADKADVSKKPELNKQSFTNSIELLQKDITEDKQEVDSTVNTSKQSELNDADESIDSKIDETIVKDNNNKSEKISKYRRTGETVMMINSVFSAALKNKLGPDGDESSSNKSASISSPLKRNRRGRRKKNEYIAKNTVDEQNMVTCATCNAKINSDDWVAHNRLEHNNLSWREGEQEIVLDDRQAVTKILKPILKEDHEIKCKKCNNSFIKVSSFTDHLEKCNGVMSANGLVTCAVCKTEMEKNKWPNHKQRQHNNLAWRVGDRPLNLNDQQLVMNILTALYKAKKPLYCEKCGTSKKSVIGFLSHQSQCGMKPEEVKVKCHLCDRKVLPVSMQTHIKMVHETPKEKDVLQNSSYFDVEVDTTSKKRKSARTAMLVISKFSSERIFQEHSKHFAGQVKLGEDDFIKNYIQEELSDNKVIKCIFSGCSYESDSVTNLLEHLNSCGAKPEQYFVCRKCLSVNITRKGMAEHLKSDHDIDVVDEEYQDTEYQNEDNEDEEDEREDIKEALLRERSKLEKNPNYRGKPTCLLYLPKQKPQQLFTQSYDYTMSFCQQHYSTEKIFNHLRYLKSDWLLLDDELIEQYLPRHEQSCDIARVVVKSCESVITDEHTFKRYNLFESDCAEGIATIFCGGPIRAMAWMPTPYTSSKCTQVLAVAALNDFDKKYLVNEQYNEESVIQFWDFGILRNKQPMTEPKLMFCLAHNFGPVWHLEWCPSGCFDLEPEDDGMEMSRMGLLAVAGSDSAVYIYSIPHLKDEQMGLIYKVKPLLKLFVALNEENYLSKQTFYATRTSWSKASDHRYMAVGYTDGVVGLFDLDTTSTLLKCRDEDGLEVLLPYKTFQPHSHMVTVLDLVHMADGKRWLLTGSFDRNIIVWDLSNDLKICSKRCIISDGLWLTNWIAFLYTSDESSTRQSTVPTSLASYRDYLYERVNLTHSLSSFMTVSASNWLNGFIYCSAVGKITAIFPHQLLFGLDNDRRLKNYIYPFGYIKLIDKEGLDGNEKATDVSSDVEQEGKSEVYNKYEPITYEGANKKYGLLFCDIKKDAFEISMFLQRRKEGMHEHQGTTTRI